MDVLKKFIFIVVGFFVGAGAILMIPNVIARENKGDPNLIHGCIAKLTNKFSIVGANTKCGKLETSVHLLATLDRLPPFVCQGCNLAGTLVLRNKDLTNAVLTNSVLTSADLRGVILKDVEFLGVSIDGANLADTDMTSASFQDSDLTGAVGMTTTILTDVTWSNTLCPDGTNSNDNSNTCIGHLEP